MTSGRAVEQRWVYRPASDRPEDLRALAGVGVHSVGVRDTDGSSPVVLIDGTHLQARPGEVVAE